MRLICAVLVLLITQLNGWVSCEESSEEEENNALKNLRTCPGGYCVKTHLCQNGTVNIDGDNIIESRMSDYDDNYNVSLEVADDPCEEFLMRCCQKVTKLTNNNGPVTGVFKVPPATCGTNYPNGYIYRVKNNAVAQFAEFPWMAALLKRVPGKESSDYFCGGSLIHPKVVLTAAHCLRNLNVVDDVTVRLGEWDTVTENEPLAHQEHAVSKVIIHENFADIKYHNDLALLILRTEADLNDHINSICLPKADDNFDDQRCMVSGWGKENFNPEGKYSEVLKKVELPVVSRQQCKNMFRSSRLGPFFRLHSSFMCAGGERGVDVCKGDGGSPLACKSGDLYVQAGIVAWGLGCGENGIPGAYVKVSNFVDWIRTTLVKEDIDI